MGRQVPVFFELLSDHERRSLSGRGRPGRWDPGEVIFHRGDAPDSAMVLLEGHVKVHTIASGGVDVVPGLLGSGEFFGEPLRSARPRDRQPSAQSTASTRW